MTERPKDGKTEKQKDERTERQIDRKCLLSGPKTMVKAGYLGAFLAFIVNSTACFLVTENSDIDIWRKVPTSYTSVFNILTSFTYTILSFIPVNAASDLLSGYLINYLSNHLNIWSSSMKLMTSKHLKHSVAIKIEDSAEDLPSIDL